MTKRPGGIKMVSMSQLFMFADKYDYMLLFFGTIASMGHGMYVYVCVCTCKYVFVYIRSPQVRMHAALFRHDCLHGT